jgi:hypothetical protein
MRQHGFDCGTDSRFESQNQEQQIALLSSSVLDTTTENLRHRCRNPKCRGKLAAPVSNPRNAFCCQACYAGFYRFRCLVCEQPLERKSPNQKVCGKRKCRAALAARTVENRFVGRDTSIVHSGSNSPDISTSKTGIRRDRAWVVVAGPKLPLWQLLVAKVPDGPGGRWQGGEYQRIEAKNAAALNRKGIR